LKSDEAVLAEDLYTVDNLTRHFLSMVMVSYLQFYSACIVRCIGLCHYYQGINDSAKLAERAFEQRRMTKVDLLGKTFQKKPS